MRNNFGQYGRYIIGTIGSFPLYVRPTGSPLGFVDMYETMQWIHTKHQAARINVNALFQFHFT